MLNAVAAKLRNKASGLRSDEAKAEFSAQFKLLAQSVNSAMERRPRRMNVTINYQSSYSTGKVGVAARL